MGDWRIFGSGRICQYSKVPKTAQPGCATSALRSFSRGDVGVKFRGFAARDGQGIPIRSGQMFGKKHDLSNVVGVMRQLAMDRLHYRMRLTADISGAREISVRQRGHRVKRELPARFPQR